MTDATEMRVKNLGNRSLLVETQVLNSTVGCQEAVSIAVVIQSNPEMTLNQLQIAAFKKAIVLLQQASSEQ